MTTTNGIEQPQPTRRVSPLQDAVERLADFAEAGIEPTGGTETLREMVALVVQALGTCQDTNAALRSRGRDVLDALDTIDVMGTGRAVEHVGAKLAAFRGALA